ncbi:MAG: thioredoxin fold domain-containing protein [Candidatus Aegiribacteria sp.]|nr:thioredoxin fold domain-containing protein [Candidatus Aegiribacteria sp.]MBD3294342.1 thioredoxin fold domain-containing protein [Candidatus Fermentibacteria bacterium]
MILPDEKPSRILCFTVILMLTSLSCGDSSGSDPSSANDTTAHEVQNGEPSLIDLGSKSCVPCQMMEEELQRLDEITGERLTVTFIDVNENPDEASQYGIRVIPTQLFLAPDGTELYRHEGYMSADQMISQWISLGYDLSEAEGVR